MPIAYIAGLVAAGIVVTIGLFGGRIDADTLPIAIGAAIGVIFYAGMTSFLPALLAIVLAEIFAWRSVFYYLAAGGLVGGLASQMTAEWGGLDFADNLLALCLAGGFTGGFVYRLIAGRSAGFGDSAGGTSGAAGR